MIKEKINNKNKVKEEIDVSKMKEIKTLWLGWSKRYFNKKQENKKEYKNKTKL